MTFQIVLLLLLTLLTVAVQSKKCPEDWMTFEETCFRATVQRNLTFEQAFRSCLQMGGSLAVIKTESEENFIEDNFFRDSINRDFWIGVIRVNRGKGDTAFRWLDGDSVEYNNWSEGQPDNHEGNEYCVMMSNKGKDNKGWHDVPCRLRNAALCSMPLRRDCDAKKYTRELRSLIRELYSKYHLQHHKKSGAATWLTAVTYTLAAIIVMFSIMASIYGVILCVLRSTKKNDDEIAPNPNTIPGRPNNLKNCC